MTTPATQRYECRGLPADSVNSWLAAVGMTVLVPRLQLSWTVDALPVAAIEHPEQDPVARVVDEWPTRDELEDMPLAQRRTGCEYPLERKVPTEAFAERIRSTRQHQEAWTLTSTMTDLAIDNHQVTHAPFDPPGPGTIKWLHHRLLKTHRHVTDPGVQLAASLAGKAIPVSDNGLGFDIARLGEGGRFVDPVVETLAFFGLAFLPVRGDGINSRIQRPRQRGWQIAGEGDFKWPAWSQPLDRYGIDALLDAWHASWRYQKVRNSDSYTWQTNRSLWDRLGIHAAWHSTRYLQATSAETNRGYGATRLWSDD